MSDNVIVLPAADSEPEISRTRQWGDFLVEVHITGAEPLPKKGGAGMGRYRPTRVLLRWETSDGQTWRYAQAVLVGPNVDLPGVDSSITIYRGDGYAECVPAWLDGLIEQFAPPGA